MGDIVKYFKFKDGIASIEKQQMPFKITTQKCISYLDIFYPNIILNDLILH